VIIKDLLQHHLDLSGFLMSAYPASSLRESVLLFVLFTPKLYLKFTALAEIHEPRVGLYISTDARGIRIGSMGRTGVSLDSSSRLMYDDVTSTTVNRLKACFHAAVTVEI